VIPENRTVLQLGYDRAINDKFIFAADFQSGSTQFFAPGIIYNINDKAGIQVSYLRGGSDVNPRNQIYFGFDYNFGRSAPTTPAEPEAPATKGADGAADSNAVTGGATRATKQAVKGVPAFVGAGTLLAARWNGAVIFRALPRPSQVLEGALKYLRRTREACESGATMKDGLPLGLPWLVAHLFCLHPPMTSQPQDPREESSSLAEDSAEESTSSPSAPDEVGRSADEPDMKSNSASRAAREPREARDASLRTDKSESRTESKGDEKSRDFVLRAARDRNVKFVRLWFTDILGMLKSTAIIADELEAALDEGITFDGGAIEGFAREDESDMIAKPDANTFQLLPFRPTEGGAVARMFCDILTPDGAPAATDPRSILKKQLKAAAEMGYTYYVGPEVEFFYFRNGPENGKPPEPLDQGGYFDQTPLDIASPLRRKTALTLEQMDIGVESSHHEGAPSQHEIDLRYTDALTMADSLMTFRLVVKEIATESGYYATFMPKPLANYNGSGLHINMSLFQGSRNAFYDKKDPDELSDVARYYIAGLLKHARELTLFTNQWVNSYKRLVPGFEAPTRVTWAMRNHADLVRVPANKPGREASRRVEYRSPDPSCNPYLVFALLLAAGLEGIRNKYELPPAWTGERPSEPSEGEGPDTLPADLNEAIRATEQGTLARKVLGDVFFDKFIANKRIEWDNYRSQVHAYEIDRYLGIL
jgi:glutamine synthetase